MSQLSSAAEAAQALDGGRLLARLRELATIGELPGGGISRIAFSEAEVSATDLVASWLDQLDLTIAVDEFGNLFASTDENSVDGEPVLVGSHLDTVPAGGWLDGALGVVAAVEAIAAIRAAGVMPGRPLEVVIWRCEEPVCFAHGKVGSLLFSGQIQRQDLHPLKDGLELARRPTTRTLPERAPGRGVGGCLELHIEQGRRLERSGHHLGVVTAVASPIRVRVRLAGAADHSGATPMDDRRDALCGASELTLAVERAATTATAAGTVATTARVLVEPGAINVVPGSAELLIDIRGVDWKSMCNVKAAITDAAMEIASRRRLEVKIELLSEATPTPFDSGVVDRLVAVARELGEEPLVMPSGAGHDAQCLAPLAPSGMLFVPSIDGLSHCPQEDTAESDLILGARALTAATVELGRKDDDFVR